MRTLFTILLLAVAAIGGWMAWALGSPVTPTRQTFVLLHPGYSTRRIAYELKSAGVIRSATAFAIWHRIHHKRSLKAGEYLFEKTATALEIHDRLVSGDVYVHTVVIPEGFNLFEIAQAIQDAGLSTSEIAPMKTVKSEWASINQAASDKKSSEIETAS